LNDWNKMTAQQKFETSEAKKQRVFEAQQREKERAFTANQSKKEQAFTANQNALNRQSDYSIAAANRASSGTPTAVKSEINKLFEKALLSSFDGKVSPKTFQTARQKWVAKGGDVDEFNATYVGYVNQTHSQDYYGM